MWYFIIFLEHVPAVANFLGECRRALKSGGVMICEVPDIEMYPRDPFGLGLHEHTNHFSKGTLHWIARPEGFELIRIETERCSRSFGFVAAFGKADLLFQPAPACEYEMNRSLFLAGMNKLQSIRASMDDYSARLRLLLESGDEVVFWAANAVMGEFLELHPPALNGTVTDSNVEKAGYFERRRVYTPAGAKDTLRAAISIFIFTQMRRSEILAQIEESFGKVFVPEHVHVFDRLGSDE